MPKINGFKLFQDIKKIDNNIKALFVTALKVNYEVLRDLFSIGGVDIDDEDIAGGRFIRKPIQIHDLVKRVKTELEKNRICKYCGWDMDEQDSEILAFFHSDCWKEYRKDGLVEPMPENVW